MKKKIFISWSTADNRIKPIAEGYKKWLNIVFDDKIKTFFSEEIEPAQNGIKHIHTGLKTANVGLVFVTQRTASNPWVLYEFGCMHKLLEKEALYLILLDLDFNQLAEIAPPMAGTQATLLNKKEDNIKLLVSIAKKMGLSDSEILDIEEKASKKYHYIEVCVDKAQENFANLPDKYAGEVPYNNSIKDSDNFQMPQIFDVYTNNILLVGMSLGTIFNIKSNSGSMDSLVKSLVFDNKKTVKILISNLWDEKLFYTFNKMIFGFGNEAYAYLNEVFFDTSSPYYLDTYIQNLCIRIAEEKNKEKHEKKYDAHKLYEAVKKQLLIKRIDLLVDTFWFIDNGEEPNRGSMLLAPLTASSGAERPVFYATKKKNERLYDSYFGVCKSGFDAMGSVLWPVKD
ncbi:toll/interleukin-1 receptor domain-containing protein [Treponema sp. OMZ 787]|uniref:toll/interleukin-1 receptor domain-containing protein n=1 Tax=Treponema sp. OMZ 787 TaxID=2563669 RepID=UPI0020A490DE|nr:toll/interleukin-1 receptor domain-containing protein [Treponema sp. OMZ 787]UTC62449.1 toll/interleukin-1 receptor domain-containing protein [Treponema sp. OMZ 787]